MSKPCQTGPPCSIWTVTKIPIVMPLMRPNGATSLLHHATIMLKFKSFALALSKLCRDNHQSWHDISNDFRLNYNTKNVQKCSTKIIHIQKLVQKFLTSSSHICETVCYTDRSRTDMSDGPP